MDDGPVASQRATRAWLRGLAEDALAGPATMRRMGKPLRDRYEIAGALSRSVELRRVTGVSVCIYVASVLLLNLMVVLHPSWIDVAMQIGFTPGTALLIASLFYRPDTPSFAREAAATVAACCFSLATVLAVGNSPIDTAQINLCMISLPVIYVLVFVRLRLAGAQIFVFVSVAMLAIVLVMRNDLTQVQRAYPMGFMLVAVVPGLLAVYYREQAAARNFLRSLLQALRIEELEAENAHLAALAAGSPVSRPDRESLRGEGVA
jgi:hypothetical protein